MNFNSIWILDDHPLFTEGLKDILVDAFPEINLKSFENPLILLKQYSTYQPDLIFLDLQLPTISGFEVLKEIKSVNPNQIIIVLSARHDSYAIQKAKEYSANGFLFKNDSLQNIVHSVKQLDSNPSNFISSSRIPENEFRNSNGKTIHLTKREIEFLQFLSQGLSTKEISTEMYISEHTVVGYRKILFQKFEVKNMIGLVKSCIELGLTN